MVSKYNTKTDNGGYDPDSISWGLAKYANAKNMEVGEVTVDTLKNSGEGLVYWCTKDIDFGARSPKSQAFMRALNWNQKWLNLYPNLLDSAKLSFRKHFCVSKSFDFTSDMRISTVSRKKGSRDE
eukprot:7922815-Karenia_brevis.AAC.1